MTSRPLRAVLLLAVAALVFAACGGDSDEATAGAEPSGTTPGVTVVSPADAQAVIEAGDPRLVVLDVRTPGEFAEARLDDAILIDINEPDFADRVAELDRDAQYVLYCRSGNRSAAAREVMDDLGFAEVYDVDGGIVAWQAAGLPVVTG